jgi:membrane protease YdiL (CAAX protease family)
MLGVVYRSCIILCQKIDMSAKRVFSFVLGFLVLFFIYHFPEYFSAFWIMATFKIGFLIAAFILSRLQGWKGLVGYGLGFMPKWISNLSKGLLIGLSFFSLSVFVSIKLGYEEITEISSLKSIFNQLPMILLITAIPSIAEDILTRGYLYAHLKFMKPIAWILLSSVIYVFNHIWRLNDGPAVLTYLFILGIILAFAVWITKSLWLAFGIHWGANIAFESSHSIIQKRELVQHDGTTWVLALTWCLLLILLVVFNFNKMSRGVIPKSN